MPANLTPQYLEAERKFRVAKSPPEKIAALEEMMAVIPKHKGTDHLRGELRGRISRLTQQLGKKSGGARSSMSIEKEGAAQVAVAGLPNSGKSLLVDILTNAEPVVADYPLTTQSPLCGMMQYEDIQIQLIDTPPLAPQTIQWWLPPLFRQAELLILTIDISTDPVAHLEKTIAELNKMRVYIGGEPDGEEVITWHKPAIVLASKTELDKCGKGLKALKEYSGGLFPVAPFIVGDDEGTARIKRLIYEALGVIRIYTKAPGKKPDFADPIVIKKGSTLLKTAIEVHKDFASNLRYARIWGSGKHDGVMIKRDHILKDGDIIELHI
jgi:ribosome-interacting GTPase 1